MHLTLQCTAKLLLNWQLSSKGRLRHSGTYLVWWTVLYVFVAKCIAFLEVTEI